MIKITKETALAEIGAIVCEALKENGIDAFLSGGAVVSIYTNNKYESFDLDFISFSDRTKIKKVMESLGFFQDRSRLYRHPQSIFMVEFPGSAVQVGEETITTFSEIKLKAGVLKLLTPTDCVKDRLSAFYHWKDVQTLDQAVWVAQAHPVNITSIQKWSEKENKAPQFKIFLEKLRNYKGKK